MPITQRDTTGTLQDRLAVLGGRLIVLALELAASDGLKPVPQPAEGVTYAHKVEKTEAAIDWTQPADIIARRVRAFTPVPGATARLHGEALKIWVAGVAPGTPPSPLPDGSILTVAPEGIAVAAMNSIVKITELQRPGGKRLAVAEFLRGFEVQPGMAFEVPGNG